MTVNDIEKNQRGATDSTHPIVSAAYPPCIYLYVCILVKRFLHTYIYIYAHVIQIQVQTSASLTASYTRDVIILIDIHNVWIYRLVYYRPFVEMVDLVCTHHVIIIYFADRAEKDVDLHICRPI